MKDSKILQMLDQFLRIGLGLGKAVLIMFCLNWLMLSVGLAICGVKLFWLIALGISLLDIVPVLGSGVVMLPWIVVCLIGGNSRLALGLAILYIVIVVVRQVMDPLITGAQIGLRPLATLGAALAGLLIFGMAGIVIGPVIAAICSVVYRVYAKNNTPPQADVTLRK
ncbi:MAG: AI-2E family transporter [Bacillota bacterium]|nr:AI-2E family transporter [Bacillota bacterium]